MSDAGEARNRALTALMGALCLMAALDALPRSAPAKQDTAACAHPARAVDGTPRLLAVLDCDGAGAPPSGAQRLLAGLPMDLNQATPQDLAALPGVGPKTALRIVAHRDTHGPFASPRALDAVRGVGPKTLARLTPLLTTTP